MEETITMNDDNTTNDQILKVAELMKGAKIGNFTTLDGDELVSRPMALQQAEFDGDLWFFTYETTDKISEIKQNPHVNVSFENSGSWVSLSGIAEQVDDHNKAQKLWNPTLKAWFSDGLETQGLTLIKVNAESAEYWDSTNPKVVQLFGFAKAALTGKQAKGGENKTVDL